MNEGLSYLKDGNIILGGIPLTLQLLATLVRSFQLIEHITKPALKLEMCLLTLSGYLSHNGSLSLDPLVSSLLFLFLNHFIQMSNLTFFPVEIQAEIFNF